MIEFRFSDFFYPGDLARAYWLMRRSERWTPAQFETYQSAQLAKLLQHSGAQIQFYRDLLEARGIQAGTIRPENAMQVLAKLPVLDKDALRAAPERFLAPDMQRYKPRAIQTSGTTGTPLTVYWDRGSNVMEICSMQRLWRWAGVRIGDSFLDLRSRPLSSQDRHVVEKDGVRYLYNWKVRGLEFSSDLIDESNLTRYYEVLLKYRPVLVRGHPRSIQYLVELIERQGLQGWRPRAVTTASEALYPFQRQQVEKAWGTAIMDSYGLKEHNVFIAQCPQGTYHVFPEYGICEVVDDGGRPVAPGQEGWVVATGLHNYAQPLLRYNTRDRAVAAEPGTCRCGRTLPSVERIVGRIDDALVTRDGRKYTGLSFAFFGRRGIRQARLVQQDLENVTVEVVTTDEYDPSVGDALAQTLAGKVGGRLRFEIKPVPEIVQETSGKFKFVVSKISQAEARAVAVR